MFKRGIAIGLLVSLLALPAPAAADDGPRAAAGPLAALSRLIDRLETVLPLPARTKALAHLRLAESKIEAVRSAKTKEAKALLREYRREIQKARKLAKKAGGDTAGRVQEATSKHLKVLEGLLDKVPGRAKEAIRHAMEVSGRGAARATAARNKEHGLNAKGKDKASKKGGPPWAKGQDE